MSLSTLDSRSLKKTPTPRSAAISPRLSLCICGIIALLLSILSVIFAILDTAAVFAARQSFRALAVIATLADFAAIATLAFFLIQVVYRQDPKWSSSIERRRFFLLSYAAPAVLSVVLTLVTYILTEKDITTIESRAHGKWANLMAGKFTLWVLSTLAQLVFYVAAIFLLPPPSGTNYAAPANVASAAEMGEATPPMTLQILQPPAAGPALISPTFSDRSSRSSWRSSIQHVVRPITSRSKLLGKQPPSLRGSSSFYSDATSIRTTGHSDAFDSWDTSSIDPQARDTVMQSAPPSCRNSIRNEYYPSTRLEPIPSARLEPIPGSRPVSPAHALDGPFPVEDMIASLNVHEAHASAFLAPLDSRPTTPSVLEANIHPLFRADSPVPPPVATPGTIVTASPLSGQPIPRAMADMSRSRASSRATSRAGSVSPMPSSSSMFTAQAFGEALNKVITANSTTSTSRDPSPPGREMTPPIPDLIFIAASPASVRNGGRPNIDGDLTPTGPASPTSLASLASKPSLASLRGRSYTLPSEGPVAEEV